MQGTVNGRKRQGRQQKSWEDNIRNWTRPEFVKYQKAVREQRKLEETGCGVICGATSTLAVKA